MKTSSCAILLVVLLVAASVLDASACTVFKLTAKDGAIVSPRTMEFGVDVHSRVLAVPRGKAFSSPAPGGGAGLSWEGRYGFIGVSGLGDDNAIFDGMNEQGLAFSALWYDASMQWPTVPPGEEGRALAHALIGTWILSSFATVDEVKAALKEVRLYGMYLDAMKQVPPVHFAVYDAKGGSIVIECDGGEIRVHDNPAGIMTNAPEFPWHLTNLRNYLRMSPHMAEPADYFGATLNPMGHGSGMIGLPGDITPASRFVKVSVLLRYVEPPADAPGALNLARHVINNVDIPKGIAVDLDKDGNVAASEWTQWTTFRDLGNRVFYFATYENPTLRKIDLKRLDLSAPRVFPMTGGEAVIDLTE